jgi:hypothetical protein
MAIQKQREIESGVEASIEQNIHESEAQKYFAEKAIRFKNTTIHGEQK